MITIEIEVDEGNVEIKGRKGSGKALLSISQGPCQDNNYTTQEASIDLKHHQIQELRDALDMVF